MPDDESQKTTPEESHRRDLEAFKIAMGGGEGDIFYESQMAGIAGGNDNRNRLIEGEEDIKSQLENIKGDANANLTATECTKRIAVLATLGDDIATLHKETVRLLGELRIRKPKTKK